MEWWAFSISVTVGIAFIAFVFWAGNWHGSVNSDRTTFKKFMEEIRKDIKEIFRRLPDPMVAGGSPLQLTEKGQMLSRQIDAASVASAIADTLRDEVQDMHPYEIQKKCFDWVTIEKLPNEYQERAKSAAFEQGIKMSQVLEVIAIEVRDILLTPEQQKSLP